MTDHPDESHSRRIQRQEKNLWILSIVISVILLLALSRQFF
ncbi:hypothetical protein [Ferviditalea candida]|uniref:Uncharacterized protein n=1 Tax=Ferviditalea candida TaxID=3108399 RepID=A0ABU5ZGU2_9BACL|nr:hypothetical protein [Paenibacillaceae bacterium T2]